MCTLVNPTFKEGQEGDADHPRSVHGEGEQRGGPLQAGPHQRQRHLQGHHCQQKGGTL